MFTALILIGLLLLIALVGYGCYTMPVYSLLVGGYEVLGQLVVVVVKIVASTITGSED
jgi:hypothetical protein